MYVCINLDIEININSKHIKEKYEIFKKEDKLFFALQRLDILISNLHLVKHSYMDHNENLIIFLINLVLLPSNSDYVKHCKTFTTKQFTNQPKFFFTIY